MEIVNTPIASVYFDRETCILHLKILPKASMDVDSMKSHDVMVGDITEEQDYVSLTDVSNLFTVDLDEISFAATSNTMRKRKAAAFYNAPLANRINILLLRRKLSAFGVPTEIFNNKEEALEWLKSYRLTLTRRKKQKI